MTNTNPEVSIIIPLFNRRSLIGETLRSIQAQTYENWEVIAVDDGSNDGSYEYVEEILMKDDRIKLYKRTNKPKGAPSCRNIGIEKSRAKFLIFLDSDDILAPYCLEQRVKYMNDHADLDFAVFHIILFTKVPGDSLILWNIFKDGDDIYRFLNSDSPWQTTSPIWTKKYLQKVGPWDEEAISWQDWEFHIRALVLNPKYDKVDALPDCFMRRDTHQRISSTDRSHEHYVSRINLFKKMYLLLFKMNILTDEYKKLFAAYFFKVQEKALVKNKNISINRFFNQAYQLKVISRGVYFLSLIYFFSLKYIKSTSYKRFWKRKLLPGYLFHKGTTGKKIKLDANKFNQLKDRAKISFEL